MADQQRKLEQAARAAWLAHVGGLTQDEIATRLGVSRQSAQRLVAQAMSEGLVKIRIDHPFADCMQIARDLSDRWNLSFCEIAPADAPADGVAHHLAAVMEQWLRRADPLTIAIGTGRTLRSAIARLPHIDCPDHRIVSLTGNIATDGSTAAYNVLFSLSDLVTARSFPLPVSVILPEGDTRTALLAQQGIARVIAMSAEAEVAFVGVGRMDDSAALLADGFIDANDLAALRKAGAEGEILGWAYDKDGQLIEGLSNDRVASAPIPPRETALVIAAAHGQAKLPAIRAALRGGLINGLVTDAATGAALLDQDRAAG
ncbi:sugar-binding transcriptional regulator [Paracoccus sp. PARArs4]|uniref:sugar-binding transcriptional regulator n=1 Tax=Paracoccus sp. PARArs4 TaxID=2853442 RepID=UPI0024A644F2|nr:sugar-binding transcriptional regulator [Paracoccus sp. PARArs4]